MMTARPRTFEDTNAGRLDAFYIDAFRGIDFETGEIVDREAEAREYRDFLAYVDPPTF